MCRAQHRRKYSYDPAASVSSTERARHKKVVPYMRVFMRSSSIRSGSSSSSLEATCLLPRIGATVHRPTSYRPKSPILVRGDENIHSVLKSACSPAFYSEDVDKPQLGPLSPKVSISYLWFDRGYILPKSD